MRLYRAACAGIIGPVIVVLAVVSMGGDPPPQFGDPLGNLSPDQSARFQAGKTAFLADEDVPGGLGPVFNDTACSRCHDQGAIGGGNDRLETRYGRVVNGVFDPLTQFDGTLVHERGIGLFNGVNFVGEAVPAVANVVAKRRVNPLFGLGFVNAIPDDTLKEIAQLQQIFTPNTAGRANIVTDVASGQPRVGRFGWKCQIGTVLTFCGNAYLNEIGVTTPLFPNENCPQGDCALLAADPAATEPNDTNATVMQFADFVTFLAPPAQRAFSREAPRGAELFVAIGCADCHLPALRTGPSPVASLSHTTFFPFSDFLLHDMGNLGDGIVQAGASGREMRTAPLWGARIRTSFLHDGRARTLRDAILSHDGQARAARDRFQLLSDRRKDDLVDFINSL
jgi:CxxC motif-containing protein (DUF1111 family)